LVHQDFAIHGPFLLCLTNNDLLGMSMVIDFAMVELNGPFSEQFPLDGLYMVVKEIDDFPLAMAT